jgi:hypothetical protein
VIAGSDTDDVGDITRRPGGNAYTCPILQSPAHTPGYQMSELVAREGGSALEELGIKFKDLRHLRVRPHVDALCWLWEDWGG